VADVITYREAVAEGLAREMRRDPVVVLLGEDIGAAGGVSKTTAGLLAEFGPDRVRDTPISEQAITGMAMGAAMTGMRPVAEIMFSDFLACCWDYLANEIPKMRYMTGGQVTVPLVIRTANGGGLGFGAQHSQATENWAAAVPGLKVVAPATPADVVGLLAAAVQCDDPVVFFEHKGLFASRGEAPPPDHLVPLGQAATVRSGTDITIVALAATVPLALAAADDLADSGVSAEVIGPALPDTAGHGYGACLGCPHLALAHRRGKPLPGRLGRHRRLHRRHPHHRESHHSHPRPARLLVRDTAAAAFVLVGAEPHTQWLAAAVGAMAVSAATRRLSVRRTGSPRMCRRAVP
jgi:pyruvate dehydrogenase E1 component beta subunit